MELERMATEAPTRQQRLIVTMSDVPEASRIWLAAIIITLILWVALPWMAPILMRLAEVSLKILCEQVGLAIQARHLRS